MTRLVNRKRNDIVRSVMSAVFDPKLAALKTRENDLALRIRNHVLGPELATFVKLPVKWFHTGARLDFKHPETEKSGHAQLAAGVPAPEYVGCNYFMMGDDALWEELGDLGRSLTEYKAERDAFEKQTRGVVYNYINVESLLEAWPTLADILSEDFFDLPPKVSLPATTINPLDEALKAALKEAA